MRRLAPAVLLTLSLSSSTAVARAAAPVVTRVDVSHAGAPLRVDLRGTALDAVTAVTVVTPDSTWTIPLAILARDDTSLTASGRMPQALEGASLLLATAGGAGEPVRLRDDVVIRAADGGGAHARLRNLYDPDPDARPKDFAFFASTVYVPPPAGVGWHRVFHVWYIRHFEHVADDDNEKTLVHAWWRDDGVNDAWKFDTDAFRCGGTSWDGLHVWAPSLVFRGGRFVMFYTGVDAAHDQRIGYATTDAIDTTDTGDAAWQRRSAPVFDVERAGWMAKRSPQQCRDPFVTEDPDGPGLAMVYAALDSATEAMAVGLARCPAGLDLWADAGHFVATDGLHSQVRRLESPHLFADSTSTTTAATLGIPLAEVPGVTWRLVFSDGDAANPDSTVRFLTHAGPAWADTALAAWDDPGPTSLFSYTRGGPYVVNVKGLQATERLRDGEVDFLAGFQGFVANRDTIFGLAFRRLDWPADPEFVLSDSAGVRTVTVPPATGAGVRLAITELVPGAGRVRFRIEAPASARARVTIFDVTGREVRRLFDGPMPAGGTDVTWDGRSDATKPVRSGVYFAQLWASGRSRAMRVPWIR